MPSPQADVFDLGKLTSLADRFGGLSSTVSSMYDMGVSLNSDVGVTLGAFGS